ncbi:MAG: flavodoxin [Bacteroidota bacterium]|nr:flavodoxin [Bacteroidota bacterium]
MKKIGLFYSFNSHKTAKLAERIKEEFKDTSFEALNAENVNEKQFLTFDNLILGVPTWFDGELPNYWDEFGPAIEDMDLKGKYIALFGLGDQVGYPENFLDAVGIMAELLESRGAVIVGLTSTQGYSFESSKAVRDNKFLGLAIDFENQAHLNKERVQQWASQLRKEFI